MNAFPQISRSFRKLAPQRFKAGAILTLFLLLFASRLVQGQSSESASAGRIFLWAGAGVSGYSLGYGDRKLLGITAVIDADSVRRFGIEGECRFLEYHQEANVHVETCMIGPRYHFNVGRYQPYAKGLVGFGNFNFPYGNAFGRYLVVSPGGGVDYRLSPRWSLRIADFEYQVWPQFTFGSISSYGVTTGIRYRVF